MEYTGIYHEAENTRIVISCKFVTTPVAGFSSLDSTA